MRALVVFLVTQELLRHDVTDLRIEQVTG
jgi:hypothetical protein